MLSGSIWYAALSSATTLALRSYVRGTLSGSRVLAWACNRVPVQSAYVEAYFHSDLWKNSSEIQICLFFLFALSVLGRVLALSKQHK